MELPCSILGFPYGSAGKKSACNVGGLDLSPGLGRVPGEGKGFPFQYSGLDCIVHGVTKSRTRLSDFTFTELWIDLLLIVTLLDGNHWMFSLLFHIH